MSELPFDQPEFQAIFDKVYGVLVIESDRGAVLVAAELISDSLKLLLEEVFPQDFKSATLLKYPGPLQTAGARTDAAYAFRLISRDLYRAISLFRGVRNKAAHSPEGFSLADHADRLREVYEATVTPWTSINHAARHIPNVALTGSPQAA